MFLAVVLFSCAPTVANGASDGKGTVYLANDASLNFDVSYDVSFPSQPQNRSWSSVSLTLFAGRRWLSVGLLRGYPGQSQLSAFTISDRSRYSARPVSCRHKCRVELSCDGTFVIARVDDGVVGEWRRADIGFKKPTLQLDAEVRDLGDAIMATLIAERSFVDGKILGGPKCGFTEQGIKPRIGRVESIIFSGYRRIDAPQALLVSKQIPSH